jgi:aldose sugar dehydrogenase
MKIYTILLALAVLGGCKKSDNAVPPPPDGNWPSDSIRVIKNDLNFPWEILWGKDDYIWMTERGGKISRIDPRTGDIVFGVQLLDVVSEGEGGLLGMVQDPGFSGNGLIYFTYNYKAGGVYLEKTVCYKFSNNSLGFDHLIIDNVPASSVHNGSRLLISAGANPKLYITTGDAANQAQPQNTGSLSGKILRLNLDGSVPTDNPVAGNPYWSFGHRNPQGLLAVGDRIYASEHGPNVEDELNIIEKGRNYGWPNVTGPCDGGEAGFCTSNSVKPPIWSSGGVTLAVCGIDYYGADKIAGFKNSILMTTLKDATLYQHQLSADGGSILSTNPYFKGAWGRLRDICISPAGRIYLCTSNGGGQDLLVEISRLQ